MMDNFVQVRYKFIEISKDKQFEKKVASTILIQRQLSLWENVMKHKFRLRRLNCFAGGLTLAFFSQGQMLYILSKNRQQKFKLERCCQASTEETCV